MNKDLLVKVSIILAVCIASVALTLGYVSVNKLSKVKTTHKDNCKYNIKFEEKSLKETLIGKTLSDKENTKLIGTNITAVIALKQKGDAVIYTWDIKNTGNKDAKLANDPVIIGLSENDKKAIEYKITINDEEVTKGMEIKAGETATAKLTVGYKKETTVVINPSTIQVLSTTFNFEQK